MFAPVIEHGRRARYDTEDTSCGDHRGKGDMAATDATGFGAMLRQLRLAAGLTQEGLAERAGVSSKAVSDLERGPARSPRLDTVALLADALGLDLAGRSRLLAAARP